MNEIRTLSVLMPVYNEARTLDTIVGRVLASPVGMDIELVCVDDCSSDESLSILKSLAESDGRIRVVSHPVNRGKGAAIRTAIEHMSGDVAIVQDSDLEYDPDEYPLVLAPILDGRADAVYGSRFASSPVRRVLFFWHSLGNKVLTALSNMANDLNLTDMETCYKAVRVDLLKRLRLTSDRFGIEPEITARLAAYGARIYEVPISYHGRTYAEGKNIGWRDGLQALWLILKFRFLDTQYVNETSTEVRQSIGKAKRFRRWTLEQFEGHVSGAIVEVHAGPGHLTEHLLSAPRLLTIERDPVHVETLRRRFGHLENLTVEQADFENGGLEVAEPFDTAICFDGLQRCAEPKVFLSRVAELVRSGGTILIQVPADQALFGPTDKAAGHVRRFSEAELEDVIRSAGLHPEFVRPFNRLGRIGWQVQQASGAERVTRFQARVFDLIVPVAKAYESLSRAPGLSLIAVVRVP